MFPFLPSCKSTNSVVKTATMFVFSFVYLLLGACSGGDNDSSTDTVENDRYVFATEGTVSVPAAQGVLANDSSSVEKVELQINPASSSTLSLASDGSFTYTPGPAVASDSFSYLATFSNGSTMTGNVTIKVVRGLLSCTELNVLQSQSASTTLNSTLSTTDNLTLTLATAPVKGTLSGMDANTGAATYTFNGGVRGADFVSYTAADLYGGTATVTFRIALTPARIMPLGDSITEGVESNSDTSGDPDLDDPAMNVRVGYRKALYDLLTADGFDFDLVGSQTDAGFDVADFDFEHEGHPGYSDAEISGIADPERSNTDEFNAATDGVYNWLSQNPADLILLHAGTNNIGFRTSSVYIESILDEIKRWESDNNRTTGLSVLVAEIIDKQDREADSDNVEIFNANIRSLIAGRSEENRFLATVDMFTPSDDWLDPFDLTHLTKDGYAAMAQVWYDALRENEMLYSCQ